MAIFNSYVSLPEGSCFERRPNDVSNDVKGYQNPDLWIHLLSCSFHSPFISSHFLSLSFHAIMKTWYRHNLNTKSHKVAGNAKPTKKSKTEKTNLLDTSWTQHWSTLEVACAQLGRSFHWNRSTLTTQSIPFTQPQIVAAVKTSTVAHLEIFCTSLAKN